MNADVEGQEMSFSRSGSLPENLLNVLIEFNIKNIKLYNILGFSTFVHKRSMRVFCIFQRVELAQNYYLKCC